MTVADDADDDADDAADATDVGKVPSAAQTYAFVAVLVGTLGVAALVVALLIGMNNSEGTSNTATSAATVTLTEFKVEPSTINTVDGAGLHVTNGGNVQHNLAIEGTSTSRRRCIDPGESRAPRPVAHSSPVTTPCSARSPATRTPA